MHSFISRNLFYRAAFLMRGEKVNKCLEEIERFYSLPPANKKEIQLSKLNELLNFSYTNNAYYRELFDEHGLKPDDINSLKDIYKIPCLSKTVLQTSGNKITSSNAPATLTRTTSGSSGVPLVLEKDVVASSYMAAQMFYAYAWHGLEIGDRLARIWGVPFGFKRQLITRTKDWILNRRRLSAFNISPDSCRNYYRTLLKFRPRYMHGLPSTISAFANMLKEIDLDGSRIGMKAVITSGEILFENDRSLISNAFGCPVIDEYGTTETGLIALQSPEGKMVESTHNMIIEIINPQTGQPVAAGETGHVCVTELHSYGVPLIRYLVGDLAVQGEEDIRLKQILGRVSDLIVCPDGKKVAAAVLDYSFGPGVKQFKAFQESLTHLLIMVVKADNFSAESLEQTKQKIKSTLSKEMQIDFEIVDSIPISPSGKITVLESSLADAQIQRPGAAWSQSSG